MKIFLRKSISIVLAVVVLTLATDLVQAQRRRPGTASLGEMNCQGINGGRYEAINEDVSIGLEIFRALAYITKGGHFSIGLKNESAQVACRLAAPGEKPKFRTLTLGFGFSDNHKDGTSRQGALVRLSIYKDGNFFEYRDVTFGQKLVWPINVTNVRSIALEAECKRTSQNCPVLYIFQDILE
ncbi:hypothetical protein [Microcoleus sp. B7-D4]|uniref:hypothetical protein n=1 Tax=Microcoleus sp. B7-D4 TaxID=2818696 RepID=UPI002FD0F179